MNANECELQIKNENKGIEKVGVVNSEYLQ